MSSDLHSVYLQDEAATVHAGRLLGGLITRVLEGHGLLTLRGNLGSGKTTLSRGLIQSLGYDGPVKSPTYTLVEPYEIGPLHVQHYDLYRLADPEELEFLGLRDFLDASTLLLVEWPERAGKLLPVPDLELELRLEGQGRRLSWQAHTERGQALSRALLQALTPAKQS